MLFSGDDDKGELKRNDYCGFDDIYSLRKDENKFCFGECYWLFGLEGKCQNSFSERSNMKEF